MSFESVNRDFLQVKKRTKTKQKLTFLPQMLLPLSLRYILTSGKAKKEKDVRSISLNLRAHKLKKTLPLRSGVPPTFVWFNLLTISLNRTEQN